MVRPKRVFIIVPTLDQKWIEKFIPSLLICTNYPFTCLVVNDKTTEKSKQYLSNWSTERPDILKAFFNIKQKGVAHNWNIGLVYALKNNADYIFIANDDVLFPQSMIGSRGGPVEKPCWLTKMVGYMEKDKKIGILSPTWFGAGVEHDVFLQQVPSYCETHKEEIEEGMLGCFFMLRSSMLKELREKEALAKNEPIAGYFDESNFKVANWEDVDFSRRVRNLGYKTIITHSIALYHFGGQTVYSHHTKDFPNFSEQNRIRFFQKWQIKLGKLWTVSNSRLIWNKEEIASSYKNA